MKMLVATAALFALTAACSGRSKCRVNSAAALSHSALLAERATSSSGELAARVPAPKKSSTKPRCRNTPDDHDEDQSVASAR